MRYKDRLLLRFLVPSQFDFTLKFLHQHISVNFSEGYTMKLSALATVLAMVTTHMAAQISIGPDKLPVAGDSYSTMSMDTLGVSEGAAGGNTTWNFSGLVPEGQARTLHYVAASGTPYSAQYPGASLAMFLDDGSDSSFTYFGTTSGRLTHFGSASPQGIMVYTDPEIQMATPLNFNDQFSDEFRGEMTGEGFVIRTSGSISILNDSYGTITLPGGVTSPAARVKFVRQNRDTAIVGGVPVFATSMTITSYEWFTPSGRFPVLQIAYYEEVINGNMTRRKHVEYNTSPSTNVEGDGATGVATTARLEQNYPNPFNPETRIRFSIPVGVQHAVPMQSVQLKVYDLVGREVATLVKRELPAGEHEVTFNASNLAAGTYVYRLQVGTSTISKKLVLVK
jgi:hypothetical protein